MSGGLSHGSGQVGVVGAGPGGLAAALLLAARGLDVTVFEAQPEVGGRTSRLRLDEYTFDRGASFFMMPYVLDEVFSAADRRLEEFVRLVRLDPMYRLLLTHDGEEIVLDATQDHDEMIRRISEISPRDGERFERFAMRSRDALLEMDRLCRQPVNGTLDLVRSAGFDALRSKTIRDTLASEFQHEAVRKALAPEALLPGGTDAEIPSSLAPLAYSAYEHGLWHPIGGCNALVRALAEALLEAGGRIETSAPVESIEIESDAVRGLKLGGRLVGETYRCEHAVINADVAWVLENLLPEPNAAGSKNSNPLGWHDSRSACVLCLGVEGELDLPHHTVRVGEDDLNSSETGLPFHEDASFWVSNPSVNDPTLAPPGHSALRVTVPTPNTKTFAAWDDQSETHEELMLDMLNRVLGVDLDGRIRESALVTPADWERARNRHGSSHGFAHTRGQLFHRRPGPRVDGLEGAWLVGAGTHPGASLPMVFRSAQIATEMLLEEHSEQ